MQANRKNNQLNVRSKIDRYRRLEKSNILDALLGYVELFGVYPKNNFLRTRIATVLKDQSANFETFLNQLSAQGRHSCVQNLISVAIVFGGVQPKLVGHQVKALIGLSRYKDALAVLACNEINVEKNITLLKMRALAAYQSKDLNLAQKSYSLLSELEPSHGMHFLHLGIVEKNLGNFDQSERSLRRAVAAENAPTQAWLSLAPLVDFSLDSPLAKRLLIVGKKARTDSTDNENMQFAMAKCHDDLGDHELSFNALLKANEIHRARVPYDGKQFEASVAKIRSEFQNMRHCSDQDQDQEIEPVFIVGMPRSGTTLIEKLLSEHLNASACGELSYLATSIRGALREHGQLDPQYIAKSYVGQFHQEHPIGTVVIDKMPSNAFLLGPALASMPKARAVFIRRSPMATCYSNFKIAFGAGNEFSFCLRDIEDRFIATQKIMDIWIGLFPDRIHCCRYESLVQTPKDTIVALARALGLERRTRSGNIKEAGIFTASLVQARQTIYQGSSEDWLRYREFLDPKLPKILALERDYTRGKSTPVAVS